MSESTITAAHFSDIGHVSRPFDALSVMHRPDDADLSERYARLLAVDRSRVVMPALSAAITFTSSLFDYDEPAHQVLRGATATVSNALALNWLELAKSGLSNHAFDRLRLIAEKEAGWKGPASRALSAASLSRFLKFWEKVRLSAVEPELMLSPRGTLQAEWYRNHRQFLEIEFRADSGDANLGLIDSKHRIEGTMSLSESVTLTKNYRNGIALKWR